MWITVENIIQKELHLLIKMQLLFMWPVLSCAPQLGCFQMSYSAVLYTRLPYFTIMTGISALLATLWLTLPSTIS